MGDAARYSGITETRSGSNNRRWLGRVLAAGTTQAFNTKTRRLHERKDTTHLWVQGEITTITTMVFYSCFSVVFVLSCQRCCGSSGRRVNAEGGLVGGVLAAGTTQALTRRTRRRHEDTTTHLWGVRQDVPQPPVGRLFFVCFRQLSCLRVDAVAGGRLAASLPRL